MYGRRSARRLELRSTEPLLIPPHPSAKRSAAGDDARESMTASVVAEEVGSVWTCRRKLRLSFPQTGWVTLFSPAPASLSLCLRKSGRPRYTRSSRLQTETSVRSAANEGGDARRKSRSTIVWPSEEDSPNIGSCRQTHMVDRPVIQYSVNMWVSSTVLPINQDHVTIVLFPSDTCRLVSIQSAVSHCPCLRRLR